MQARSALGPRRSGMPIRPERVRCACARARSRTGPQWALQPSGTGASHHDVPRSRRLQRSAGRLPSCPGAPLCLVNCVQRLPPRHDALRVVGSTCPSSYPARFSPHLCFVGKLFFFAVSPPLPPPFPPENNEDLIEIELLALSWYFSCLGLVQRSRSSTAVVAQRVVNTCHSSSSSSSVSL